MSTRIALVGDFDPAVTAHRGIERSLNLARETDAGLSWEWLHTSRLENRPDRLEGFHGTWVVPASPYASEAAALEAIRLARAGGRPFLGTCGGFQHAMVEYARNVLGIAGAAHGEADPGAEVQVIAPLACFLVEEEGGIILEPGTRLREIYGEGEAREGYHCRYGLNPDIAGQLVGTGHLSVGARDTAGEIRAVELPSHPFYFATLYQPERRALAGLLHPLVAAFLAAAGRHATALDSNPHGQPAGV